MYLNVLEILVLFQPCSQFVFDVVFVPEWMIFIDFIATFSRWMDGKFEATTKHRSKFSPNFWLVAELLRKHVNSAIHYFFPGWKCSEIENLKNSFVWRWNVAPLLLANTSFRNRFCFFCTSSDFVHCAISVTIFGVLLRCETEMRENHRNIFQT